MLTKNLIQILEELIKKHKDSGVEEMMGEHEIMIDVFKKVDDHFEYAGFSKDIVIERSSDGVYDILTSFASSV